MELKLVSFKLAKMLKEIGFDWECYARFSSCGSYIDNLLKDVVRAIGNSTPQKLYNAKYGEGGILAPTLELAKMWFREVHNIDVSPICTYKSRKLYHLGIIFINADNMVDTIIIKSKIKEREHINMLFDSYNDALEVGLIKACEILKEKNK